MMQNSARVYCKGCIRNIERAKAEGRKPAGNYAQPRMGHALVFTPTGRIAACMKEAWEGLQGDSA